MSCLKTELHHGLGSTVNIVVVLAIRPELGNLSKSDSSRRNDDFQYLPFSRVVHLGEGTLSFIATGVREVITSLNERLTGGRYSGRARAW